MPARIVHLHQKARERIAAASTCSTMRPAYPGGRNVMIQKAWGAPTVTEDGAAAVTFENIGARMEKKKGSAATAAGEEGEEEY